MSLSIHGLATNVSIAGVSDSTLLENSIRLLQADDTDSTKVHPEVTLLPLSSLLFYAELEALGSDGVEPGERKFNLTVNCLPVPGEDPEKGYSSLTFFLISDTRGSITYVNAPTN